MSGSIERIDRETMLIWGDGDALGGRQMQEQLADLIGSAELDRVLRRRAYPAMGGRTALRRRCRRLHRAIGPTMNA